MTTTVPELLPPRVSETGVITIPNVLPVEEVSTEKGRKLRDRTRGTLLQHLNRCGFSLVPPVYNQDFEDLVFAEARSYGWDVASMHSTLIIGAGITSALYSHLTDVETLLYIAIFTSLVVDIDDLCTKDAEILQGVSEFIRQFHSKESQMIPVLQHLEAHLLKCDQYLHPTAADIIVRGTLRFISGCYLVPTLPVELVDLIIDKVVAEGDRRCISSCALVSRSCAARIRHQIFHEVTFFVPDDYHTCSKFLALSKASPTVPALVRKLVSRNSQWRSSEWVLSECSLVQVLPSFTALTELSIVDFDITESTPFIMLSHVISLKLNGVCFTVGSPIPFLSCFPELQHLSMGNIKPSTSSQLALQPILNKLTSLQVTRNAWEEEAYLHSILSMLPSPSKLKVLSYPWLTLHGPAPQHYIIADSAPELEELTLPYGLSRSEELPAIPRIHGRAIRKFTLQVYFRAGWTKPDERLTRETLGWLKDIFTANPKECTVEDATVVFNIANIMEIGQGLEYAWIEVAQALTAMMTRTLRKVTLSFVGSRVEWCGTKAYTPWDIEDGIEWLRKLFAPCQQNGTLEITTEEKRY